MSIYPSAMAPAPNHAPAYNRRGPVATTTILNHKRGNVGLKNGHLDLRRARGKGRRCALASALYIRARKPWSWSTASLDSLTYYLGPAFSLRRLDSVSAGNDDPEPGEDGLSRTSIGGERDVRAACKMITPFPLCAESDRQRSRGDPSLWAMRVIRCGAKSREAFRRLRRTTLWHLDAGSGRRPYMAQSYVRCAAIYSVAIGA